MLGLMQDQPLLISSLIEFAARHHADAQIVSRRVEGDLHRYTYRDAAVRARQAAQALDRLGLEFGHLEQVHDRQALDCPVRRPGTAR